MEVIGSEGFQGIDYSRSHLVRHKGISSLLQLGHAMMSHSGLRTFGDALSLASGVGCGYRSERTGWQSCIMLSKQMRKSL